MTGIDILDDFFTIKNHPQHYAFWSTLPLLYHIVSLFMLLISPSCGANNLCFPFPSRIFTESNQGNCVIQEEFLPDASILNPCLLIFGRLVKTFGLLHSKTFFRKSWWMVSYIWSKMSSHLKDCVLILWHIWIRAGATHRRSRRHRLRKYVDLRKVRRCVAKK